jgi:hypothetical protein
VTPSSEREYSMLDTDRARDSLADTDADADDDDGVVCGGGVCVGDGGDEGGGDCDESSDDGDCDDDGDEGSGDDNDGGDVCVRGGDVADVDEVTSLADTVDDVVD